MRTKDDILHDASQDIINPDYVGKEPYWLEYRKIEVLIDIRDSLDNRLLEIDRDIDKILDALKK